MAETKAQAGCHDGNHVVEEGHGYQHLFKDNSVNVYKHDHEM